MNDGRLEALRRAVAAVPDDVELRLHLAEQLLDAGMLSESIAQLGVALSQAPDNAEARVLMGRATATAPRSPAAPTTPTAPIAGFDWSAAEHEVRDLVKPAFVGDAAAPSLDAFDTETSTVTLADVGGMETVKQRLNAAFLAPLRNPELRRLYGKSLRGGLLMYGPPGCGKTFIARAIAGELDAKFISAGLSDVLDPMLGTSENNVHELFQLARREAPAVLFLDEIDALGQRRSQTRNNAMRGVVVQLLQELDGVADDNEGVFLLAATNQPWDLDPALRRPGRLDRTVLVLPPDLPAREAIFRRHLDSRPVEGVDLRRLAQRTEGFSGADIAHICETAAELALMDSVETGTPRMIGMPDLERALTHVQPSVGAWLDSVRNLVLFGDDDGTFGELKSYLKHARRL